MKLYARENVLKKIRPFFRSNELIKVLVGVRRSGKSSIMQLIINELIESGIDKESIVYINLDKRPYRKIKTADQLDDLLSSKLDTIDGDKFLFVDEVQNVKDFEEVINSFREDGNCSIFITGSNAYLLSGELATKLTGRYMEFYVGTLSFSEYIGMKQFYKKPVDSNLDNELASYITEGGFPYAIQLDAKPDKANYVRSVIDEIYQKDIKRNRKIRDKRLFEQVKTYVINNFGTTSSVESLCNYLKKVNGKKPSAHTIYNYLGILEDAKIISRCNRFDMKSKRSLNGEEKYYLSDLSFYFATNVDGRINYGPTMENIVHNYALSNGYSVSIGKIGGLEVDFIVRDGLTDDYAYIQVAKTIFNEIYDKDGKLVTEEREYAPLESIKDGYPKYLVTLDKLLQKRNGIKHVNLINFLLSESRFN